MASSSNGQQIVQKLQLVQGNAGQPVTSLNGQPVTFVQIVPNNATTTVTSRPSPQPVKKRPPVDLSQHYNVVTVLPPKPPNKPNELATYHYLDESGQPFEKRQRVQRGGLRSCAKEVCDKVREKGRTTYTEVANEIVTETVSQTGDFDEKNIRRRVYDALNVLMALNIVHKEKNKERTISWVGLPTSNASHDKTHFHSEKNSLQRKIRQKEAVLRELLLQHVAFKRLVSRNKSSISNQSQSVALPFICISTGRDTEIDCSISEDQSEYHLKFNNKFELYDDIEVLGRLGLTDPNGAEELLPTKLRHFLQTTKASQNSSTESASTSAKYKNFKIGENSHRSSEDIVILTQRPESDQVVLGTEHASNGQNEIQIVEVEDQDKIPDVKIEKNTVSRSLSYI